MQDRSQARRPVRARGPARLLAFALGLQLAAIPVAGQKRPGSNRWTEAAEKSLALALLQKDAAAREPHYRAALEAARKALESNPENPTAWLFAGQAHAGLGEYAAADSAFRRAESLHAEYAAEIEEERRSAWARAYDEGAEAYRQQRIPEAIAGFEKAALIYQRWPHARVVLGWLYTQQGDTARALAHYRAALDVFRSGPPGGLNEEQLAEWRENEENAATGLGELLGAGGKHEEAEAVYRDFLARHPGHANVSVRLAAALAAAGRQAEASEVFAGLLARTDLTEDHLFQIGAGLFDAGRYTDAARTFRMLAERNPHSRDAWYNLTQSLYLQADSLQKAASAPGAAADARQRLAAVYEEMAAAAEHALESDAYNRELYALVARAYRGLGELGGKGAGADRWQQRVAEVARRFDALPIAVSEVRFTQEAERVRVTGVLENLKLAPGSAVKLRWTLLGAGGQVIGTAVVEVAAPAAGQSARFEGTIPASGAITGWKYELAS